MPPQSVTLRISAKTALRRLRWQIGYKLKRRLDAPVGWIIGPLFRLTRRFDRVWLSNFVGALMLSWMWQVAGVSTTVDIPL